MLSNEEQKTYSYALPFKSTEAGWITGLPIEVEPEFWDQRLTVIIA